jgi:hypothetical protein
MAFKLKDLMVDVLPGAGGAAGQNQQAQCPTPSIPQPCPIPSLTQHCPVPSIVHCPAPSGFVGCVSPSVPQPLCPFPSLHTQCPFPSINQAAMACPAPSITHANGLAAFNCPFPSLTNTGGGAVNATQLSDLAILKQQLQQHLAQVEQQEQAAHAAAKPQTLEQAQDLHSKMQDAMGELQAHIDELKKNQP